MKRHLYWPWHLFLINFNKIKCNKFEIYKCKSIPALSLAFQTLWTPPTACSLLLLPMVLLHLPTLKNEQHITCYIGSSDSNYLTAQSINVLCFIHCVRRSSQQSKLLNLYMLATFTVQLYVYVSNLCIAYFWAIHLLFFVVCYYQFTRRNNLFCLSMQNWRPIQIIVAWLPSSDTLS